MLRPVVFFLDIYKMYTLYFPGKIRHKTATHLSQPEPERIQTKQAALLYKTKYSHPKCTFNNESKVLKARKNR